MKKSSYGVLRFEVVEISARPFPRRRYACVIMECDTAFYEPFLRLGNDVAEVIEHQRMLTIRSRRQQYEDRKLRVQAGMVHGDESDYLLDRMWREGRLS